MNKIANTVDICLLNYFKSRNTSKVDWDSFITLEMDLEDFTWFAMDIFTSEEYEDAQTNIVQLYGSLDSKARKFANLLKDFNLYVE